MKYLKRFLLAVIIGLIPIQSVAEENRHLFIKGDFSSLNFWTLLASMGTSALINRNADDFLWDNIWCIGMLYNGIGSDMTKTVYSFKPADLFSNFGTGVKVGYRTRNTGFFNYKGYGSIHYRTNNQRFSLKNERDKHLNSLHRLQLGVGGIVDLARIDQPLHVIIDLGLRFNIPLYYSGPYGEGPGCLNWGFTPVLGVSFAGRKLLKTTGMNLGFFCELPGYHVFKKSDEFPGINSIKTYSFGFNLTICPFKD